VNHGRGYPASCFFNALLRVLVWQDQTGAAFVTYNAARHMLTIAQRHGLPATDVVVTQAERTEELMTTIADTAVR
jgi:hypothetical protein